MALHFISTKLTALPSILRPLYDALFAPSLPFSLRWRTLTLTPLNILTALITSPNWLFTNTYSVIYIPTRSGPKRCLVFHPPPTPNNTRPKPLHIDAHGGAFLGGLAEHNARWCAYLAARTGAIVISVQYRAAPRHVFPCAHDDVDDIASYLISHAADFGADPKLVTVGGSSAGGNLLLGASRHVIRALGVTPLAFVGFCPVLDMRLRPEEKPVPAGWPKKDPVAFLMPLFDAYAGAKRAENLGDARLHPILSTKEDLPSDVLVVVAGIDVLVREQLEFVERVRGEVGEGRRVEVRVFEKGFHGWLELPKAILEEERMGAFNASVDFIKEAHRKHGWDIEKLRAGEKSE